MFIYRVIWDASCDVENKKFGASIIIRDSEGEVIASMCMPKKFVSNPALVELNVLERVVEFCMKLGLDYVVFEGDA